jgi:hypothetical protein
MGNPPLPSSSCQAISIPKSAGGIVGDIEGIHQKRAALRPERWTIDLI